MLVVGAGATGVQVASIFGTFGSRVTLYQASPRILMSEDEDVAVAMRSALQDAGIRVLEDAGRIDGFETCSTGVRLLHTKGETRKHLDAALAVIAVGWVANTDGLGLAAAGVETDSRGFIQVDSSLRTSATNIWAAGDVTGRVMVVHEAVRQAYVAATNAALGTATVLSSDASPLGSFTDPEYAAVGLTEEAARATHDVVVATERFDSLPRPLIDGRSLGFCKLIADRGTHRILGCHVVGERAVELAQVAAVAMAGGMTVDQLAHVPFSFPTYANAVGRAAVRAASQLTTPGSAPDEAVTEVEPARAED